MCERCGMDMRLRSHFCSPYQQLRTASVPHMNMKSDNNLTIPKILTYDGDVVQIALNYIVLILFGFVHLFTCFRAPVNPTTKIIERLNAIPLYLLSFGLQIGFYEGVGTLGVSLIWSSIFGYLSRQIVFYWPWTRRQSIALLSFFLGVIFAAVAYLQCAIDTSNLSSLWADIICFLVGFTISWSIYWHVRR